MTLSQGIARLEAALKKHGDVELFFDCPDCLKSFTPNMVGTAAVHITSVPADAPTPKETE